MLRSSLVFRRLSFGLTPELVELQDLAQKCTATEIIPKVFSLMLIDRLPIMTALENIPQKF
jgi:hypothetical protein